MKSLGEDASLYAEVAGLDLFDWQNNVLDIAMHVDEAGKWCARDVCLIVSRQNGKGSVLTARCIYGLFVLNERIIHTAHEFKTASDAYYRIKGYIDSRPKLAAKVKRSSNQYGLEYIELRSGAKLKFLARTRGSGRGLSSDLVIIDEAYELTNAHMNALIPTQMTSDNPQTWFTSSAVDQVEHPNGKVLARQRQRGLLKDARIAFAEWSADEGEDFEDPLTAAAANPSLGLIIDQQVIDDARASLSPKSYGVEILGIGDWPEVVERPQVIDMAHFGTLATISPTLVGPVSLGVSMTADRKWVSIAAAQRTSGGRTHLEIGFHEAPGRRAVECILRLIVKWDPCCLIIRSGSPAMALVPALADAGIEPELITAAQDAQACGGFYDDAINADLSHSDDPRLIEALAGAVKKDTASGAFRWDPTTNGVVSPLDGATLAHYGLVTFGSTVKPPPPDPDFGSETVDADSFDVMSAAF